MSFNFDNQSYFTTLHRFSSRYQSKVGYVITELGKDRLEGGSGFTSWQLTKAPSTILPIGTQQIMKEKNASFSILQNQYKGCFIL